MIMTIVSGTRKNAWPIVSIQLRTVFGSIWFTMSMRMCSLASRVHGEHSRNTMLNSTHCSSSQEFDEVSKILRMLALTVETITAARINHAIRLPSHVVVASITRVAGSNAFSTASRAPTGNSPLYGHRYPAGRHFILLLRPHGGGQRPLLPPNPMPPSAVNGEIGLSEQESR